MQVCYNHGEDRRGYFHGRSKGVCKMLSITMFILIATGAIWLTMCIIFGVLKFTFRAIGALVVLPALLLIAIPLSMCLC